MLETALETAVGILLDTCWKLGHYRLIQFPALTYVSSLLDKSCWILVDKYPYGQLMGMVE